MTKTKGYFPLFVDLSKKKVVVIGAGKIATRRITTLLPFVGEMLVVAPQVSKEILEFQQEGQLLVEERGYEREDLYDAQLVLAATNHPKLNEEIYSLCKCMGILVNVCSNQNKCDFHFPGIIQEEEIVIGINAGGQNHKKAKEVRMKIEACFNKKVITIGSRESKLAVVQSEMVRDFLRKQCPDQKIELLTMKTTGDIILDRTLDQIGGKGLFVKELDKALLDKKSDLSVHSLKDMPMEIPKELPIVAFSKREDPRDVLILPKGVTVYTGEKPIGCSSLRRTLQLKELYPAATCKSVRGNVITRLSKLDNGEYGALVLAAAGIKRLGLEERISRYFGVDELLPAAGQGILAIQGREGEDYSYLDAYKDLQATYAAQAERAFVRYLEGGCSSPVAAHAIIKGDTICLEGLYYEEETGHYRKGSMVDVVANAEKLGIHLAQTLQRQVREELR